MALIILFLIGLWCFLAVIGYVFKFILGKNYDEEFVGNFVKKSMNVVWKITILSIAGLFVYVVIALIQTL